MGFLNLTRRYDIETESPFIEKCLATMPAGAMVNVAIDESVNLTRFTNADGNIVLPAGLLVFRNEDDVCVANVITAIVNDESLILQEAYTDMQFVGLTINEISISEESDMKGAASIMTLGQVNAARMPIKIGNGADMIGVAGFRILFRNLKQLVSD